MVSMGHIVLLAVITTMCVLFTLRRVISWRLIFGYAVIFDVTFTVLMIKLFAGSVTGAASATLAGLFLAVALTIGKMLVGYERLAVRRIGLKLEITKTRHEGGLHWLVEGVKAWAVNQTIMARNRTRS